jgi:2-oxoglutarate ferredoxin oxidoreductase subunit gamma
MSKMELRLAGSGGQGVILATVILAEAAVIAGKYTAQSQSYGPEARGGSAKAEVIISDDPIGFTKVQKPSFLMALTQDSLNKYGKNLPEGCIVVVDDSIEHIPDMPGCKVLTLPILSTAREKVGRAQTANIVAVGAINDLLHLVDHEHLREAVLSRIPKGTEELNMKALEMGMALNASV